MYAIDTANGEIVWSRIFGLGWAGEPGKNGKIVGGRVDVVKVYVIKPVGSGGGVRKKDNKKKGKTASVTPEEVTQPEVVLIAQRTAHNVSFLSPQMVTETITISDVGGYRCFPRRCHDGCGCPHARSEAVKRWTRLVARLGCHSRCHGGRVPFAKRDEGGDDA